MVLVDVIVAERVNKVAGFEIVNMRDQMRQQCIRTDVEWHTEKRIRRTKIEIQGLMAGFTYASEYIYVYENASRATSNILINKCKKEI